MGTGKLAILSAVFEGGLRHYGIRYGHAGERLAEAAIEILSCTARAASRFVSVTRTTSDKSRKTYIEFEGVIRNWNGATRKRVRITCAN